MVSTGDPVIDQVLRDIEAAIEPTDEEVAFLGAYSTAIVFPEKVVCWVTVSGFRSPVPVTNHRHQPNEGADEEYVRVPLPRTGLYLQYAPEVGPERTPGAFLHYTDYQGLMRTPTPCYDAVWYNAERQLPFGAESLAPGTPTVTCRAFRTENEARHALGLSPR